MKDRGCSCNIELLKTNVSLFCFAFQDSTTRDDPSLDYDEFGFRLDENLLEDGPECDAPEGQETEDEPSAGASGGSRKKPSLSRLISGPFEDVDQESQKRLKWLAHLEFAAKGQDHSPAVPEGSVGTGGSTGTWDSRIEGITRTEKLRLGKHNLRKGLTYLNNLTPFSSTKIRRPVIFI